MHFVDWKYIVPKVPTSYLAMRYNILFLGYWNLDDSLTQATVLPHLDILKKMKEVESLHFANTQREEPSSEVVNYLKSIGVTYQPFYSKNIRPNLANKVLDFFIFPRQIKRYCKEQRINLIIARGAPAGVLAYKATKHSNIPFIVESYEPHADYMKYSQTWKSYDPRYIFQKNWDKQVIVKAKNLVTVSHNYKQELLDVGVDVSKIEVVPCVVNQDLFFPDETIKFKMREELKIPQNATVGVYAGKFGNLYYDKEAFRLFKAAYENFENFYLLLLSNEKDEFINQRLEEFEIPHLRLIKKFVKHTDMPKYLNVADFAFATIKNIKVSQFQSPVKTGEYWACGLPILLTKGVGDESEFIESEKGGVLIYDYSTETLLKVINQLKELLNSHNKPSHYASLAEKHRGFQQVEAIYKKILL